ncbi:DUF3105 domain-containing protein [Agrobacterium rubi]|nr:DUF3105 domain-containing protein [Agrobacterium rubi]NTF24658.1 DUF3105 domain-containing protein [Agrobacterium rubi]
MDVANSHHLEKMDYDSDVTAEAIAKIRERVAPQLEGRVFTLISSADPSAEIGAEYIVRNGVAERV